MIVAFAVATISLEARGEPAQFSSQRLEPAFSALNYLVTESASVLPNLSGSALLYICFTNRPVILSADERDDALVNYQLGAHLALAFGLMGWLELGLGLPVTLTQSSEDLTPLGRPEGETLGAGVGDLRLHAKARIWSRGAFSLALSAPLSLPTGSAEDLIGGRTAFAPRVIAGLDSGYLGGAINVGYRFSQDQTFIGPDGAQQLTVDDEVFGSIAGRGTVWPGYFDVMADFFFSLATRELDREEAHLELAYGLVARPVPALSARILVSHGLTPGIGTPSFRILAGVAYQVQTRASAPAAKRPAAARTDGDSDGDGVPDSRDRCVSAAEDRDGFQDEDGCPDPDNDGDGVADARDHCPSAAEDRDGFQDEDGCPDPDNDGDGVADVSDRCPNAAEDRDGFQDEDGCPDPDDDGDGIVDARDRCPDRPETFNGVEDEDGCPDKGEGPVQIERGRVTTPPVHFATNRDVILRKSYPMLGQVFDALKSNAWIKRVRIEGHTDSLGDDQRNLALSRRRAESVRRFLMDLGIAPARLEAEGYGETRPVANDRTSRGRASNRRVDFVILEPAP